MMEEKLEYADSKETKGIKLFFYLKSGLSLLNEFKNLIAFVFAAYFALKMSNPWLLAGMFIVSMVGLTGVGWLCVKRWNKILEWLSVKYGTHYSIRNFQIQEEMLQVLKDINSKQELFKDKLK